MPWWLLPCPAGGSTVPCVLCVHACRPAVRWNVWYVPWVPGPARALLTCPPRAGSVAPPPPPDPVLSPAGSETRWIYIVRILEKYLFNATNNDDLFLYSENPNLHLHFTIWNIANIDPIFSFHITHEYNHAATISVQIRIHSHIITIIQEGGRDFTSI